MNIKTENLTIKIKDSKDFLDLLKNINLYLKKPVAQYTFLIGDSDAKMEFVLKKFFSKLVEKIIAADKILFINIKLDSEQILFYKLHISGGEPLYLVLPQSKIDVCENISKEDSAMLLVRSICSKKCIFCSRQNYFSTKNKTDYESRITDLLQQLTRFKEMGANALSIGGDEPLTYSKFNLLLKFVNLLGFKDVTLLTSMIKLEPDYIEYMVKMGVNKFYLPLYGHNSQVHDSITGEENSFDNLMNFLSLIKDYNNVEVILHTIVLRQNFGYLDQIIDFYRQHNYTCNLQVVMPFSDNFEDYKKVAVKYSDLAKYKIIGNMLPKCIYKDTDLNYREKKKFKLSDWKEKGQNLIFFEDRTGESKNISETNYEVLVKVAKCKNCRYYEKCNGVFYQYLQIFGDEELAPIK